MWEGFEKELKSCINQSLIVDEFEIRWAFIIDNFELENISHLQYMYKIREKSIPAYFKGTSFGFMSTKQRSESMNALFKDMVDCHMSIYKFVTQYEKNIRQPIWQRRRIDISFHTNKTVSMVSLPDLYKELI